MTSVSATTMLPAATMSTTTLPAMRFSHRMASVLSSTGSSHGATAVLFSSKLLVFDFSVLWAVWVGFIVRVIVVVVWIGIVIIARIGVVIVGI